MAMVMRDTLSSSVSPTVSEVMFMPRRRIMLDTLLSTPGWFSTRRERRRWREDISEALLDDLFDEVGQARAQRHDRPDVRLGIDEELADAGPVVLVHPAQHVGDVLHAVGAEAGDPVGVGELD